MFVPMTQNHNQGREKDDTEGLDEVAKKMECVVNPPESVSHKPDLSIGKDLCKAKQRARGLEGIGHLKDSCGDCGVGEGI